MSDEITAIDYPLAFQPLERSHKNSEFETELAGLFVELFEETLREKERDLNVYGAPHLGSFELISRFVKENGLALINNDDEEAMRYLYKAWISRNPKRGLHFIRTYLQLLWPNRSHVYQLWYQKNAQAQYPAHEHEAYPTLFGGATNPEDDHFLTCRIAALVEFDNSPITRGVIEPALRSSLGAEFVLELRSLLVSRTSLAMASGSTFGGVIRMTGDLLDRFKLQPVELSAASAMSSSSVFRVSGEFDNGLIAPTSVIATGSGAIAGQLIKMSGSA